MATEMHKLSYYCFEESGGLVFFVVAGNYIIKITKNCQVDQNCKQGYNSGTIKEILTKFHFGLCIVVKKTLCKCLVIFFI